MCDLINVFCSRENVLEETLSNLLYPTHGLVLQFSKLSDLYLNLHPHFRYKFMAEVSFFTSAFTLASKLSS